MEEGHHDELDDGDDVLRPHNILDPVVFGRRLRALRIIRGFDRVADLALLIRSTAGVEVSDRTIYAVERGQQPPTVDFYMACLYVLRPDGGPRYFLPAFRADVREAMDRYYCDTK